MGVIRRGDAEQVLQGVVPGGGEIGDGQVARKQGLFQAEAEQNVGGVGEFVGFNADAGALDVAQAAFERALGDGFVEGAG